jgi:hypothetical protein
MPWSGAGRGLIRSPNPQPQHQHPGAAVLILRRHQRAAGIAGAGAELLGATQPDHAAGPRHAQPALRRVGHPQAEQAAIPRRRVRLPVLHPLARPVRPQAASPAAARSRRSPGRGANPDRQHRVQIPARVPWRGQSPRSRRCSCSEAGPPRPGGAADRSAPSGWRRCAPPRSSPGRQQQSDEATGARDRAIPRADLACSFPAGLATRWTQERMPTARPGFTQVLCRLL